MWALGMALGIILLDLTPGYNVDWMCYQCDYSGMLEASGLGSTPHRLRVLEVIGNNTAPLSAQDIYSTLSRSHGINRVTVYRILDALVDCGLVQRISGGRAFFMESPPTPTTSPIPIFTANPAETWSALTRQALPSAPTAWKERFPGRFKISKCDSTVSARTASRLRNP